MSTLDEIHSADFVECTLVVVLLKKKMVRTNYSHTPVGIGSGSFNKLSFQLWGWPRSRTWELLWQRCAAGGWARLGTAGQLTTGTVLGANSFGHFAVEAELPHFSLEGESKCLELEHTWHEIS